MFWNCGALFGSVDLGRSRRDNAVNKKNSWLTIARDWSGSSRPPVLSVDRDELRSLDALGVRWNRNCRSAVWAG